MNGVDENSGPATQEVRLAVTMVGGVSLAIWMGGVAREISHVVQASRQLNGAKIAPEMDQAEAIRACYRELLKLLHISVSVDVLTGTSAGGINAACLGVAEGYQSTLGNLRDVWLETGSFSNLLRDPDEDQPPSVLKGDEVMLSRLNQALNSIADGGHGDRNKDITVILTRVSEPCRLTVDHGRRRGRGRTAAGRQDQTPAARNRAEQGRGRDHLPDDQRRARGAGSAQRSGRADPWHASLAGTDGHQARKGIRR